MRVLVSSAPAVGHLGPLLPFATALARAGCDVLVATNTTMHDVVGAVGLTATAVGMSMAEMRAERERRWPETMAQPATVWATRMWGGIMAPSTLADLERLIADWRPDLVVHEEGEYAAPVAAAATGLPSITMTWGSPLRPRADIDELAAEVGPMWAARGLELPTDAGLYRAGVVDPCPAALGVPADLTVDRWSIRPTSPFGGEPVGGPGAAPDVYIGFGTVPLFANAAAELTAAVTTCVELGRRVVVTAPDPSLRAQLTAIDPALVTAVEFVSLADVLASCALVVAHAGAGTVLAALAAAVPLVLVPRGSPSQARMALACQGAGVATLCDSAADIPATISAALDDQVLRARARDVAAEIARMPHPVEVAESIVRRFDGTGR